MPSTGNTILDFILIVLFLIVLLILGKAAIEAFSDAAIIPIDYFTEAIS